MKPAKPTLLIAEKPARAVTRYNRQATPCPVSGKRSYRTKRKAQRVAERTKAVAGDNIYVYRCQHCSLFHLTSKPEKAAA